MLDLNEAPTLSAFAASGDEGSPKSTPGGERDADGEQVALALDAADEDDGQLLTFALSEDAEDEQFALNPCSGEFRVRDGAALNHERVSLRCRTRPRR